jgi:hypothetical protein
MNTSKSYLSKVIKLSPIKQLALCVSLFLLIAAPSISSATAKESLAVLPFEIVDNIPAPGGDQRNQEMLSKLTQFIGEQIEQAGLFQVAQQSQVNKAVRAAQLGTYIHTCNQCEYEIARQLDANKVMVGWIYKMSLLILTMHIEIKDVASETTLISKAYDFRGDNEKAWLRAAKYMVRDLQEMLGKALPPE